jgi:hypothetical protein
MSENLKDILSHLNPEVDQEKLLEYLQGKLSAQQQHEVEKGTMEEGFEADALEGLEQFSDKRKIQDVVDQLNLDLKKKTEKKKKLRQRLELKLDPSVVITIVIVLILAVLSYFVIQSLLKR